MATHRGITIVRHYNHVSPQLLVPFRRICTAQPGATVRPPHRTCLRLGQRLLPCLGSSPGQLLLERILQTSSHFLQLVNSSKQAGLAG